MNYNELITKLVQSDESSWIACHDKDNERYILKDDISVSIFFPDNDVDGDYYNRVVTNPNYKLAKNIMYLDDLKIIKGFVQLNGTNIISISIHYDLGNAMYLPSESQILDIDGEFISPKWVADLTFFMSDEPSGYYSRLDHLGIKIEQIDI